MSEGFGNSLLGLGIFTLMMWAWYNPQGVAEWITEYESSKTNFVEQLGNN